MIEYEGQNNPAELSVPVISSQLLSFENILDNICERLTDTKQQGSLKKIHKLEETLNDLEKEINEILELIPVPPNRGME
jgi:hypothetical protein